MTAAILFLEEKTTWLSCGTFRGRSHLSKCERTCPVGSYRTCVCFSVIQLDLNHTPEPRHVLSRHSLPITDLHCGMMGVQARVVTASLDQTVKVRRVCHTCTGTRWVSTNPASHFVNGMSCIPVQRSKFTVQFQFFVNFEVFLLFSL